jgi:hypothetical protein
MALSDLRKPEIAGGEYVTPSSDGFVGERNTAVRYSLFRLLKSGSLLKVSFPIDGYSL